jgi:hypothetical protein
MSSITPGVEVAVAGNGLGPGGVGGCRGLAAGQGAVRPPLPSDSRVVNTMSVSVEAAAPWAAMAARKAVSTAGPVTRWCAVTDSAYREWSPGPCQDLSGLAAGEPVAGEVGLLALVGLVGGELM